MRRAVDYARARFVVLGDAPVVVWQRPVLDSELPALGLFDIGRADNDPPLYLVVLRGDLGLNPWLARERYGPENQYRDQLLARYVALAMDLRTLQPAAWQVSRTGGLFRTLLGEPSLPDETPPLTEAILTEAPPWSRAQPTRPPTPGPRPPCHQPIPGGSWCGSAPPCRDAGTVPVGSCGLAGLVECYGRAWAVVPDVCGRGDPKQYVEIAITDDGFAPAELTLPHRTEVLWVNRGSRSHAVTMDRGVDSGAIAPGGRWSITFFHPVDIPYYDREQPDTARGRIKIEGCLPGGAGTFQPAPVQCLRW